MNLLAAALALRAFTAPAAPSQSHWERERASMLAAAQPCAADRLCVAVDLHVIQEPGERAVREAQWWQGQLNHAKKLFAPVGVDFRLRSVQRLPVAQADVLTRAHRDAFLSEAKSRDGIDVFLVRSLADVDKKGAFIRGVHWRRRDQLRRRWVILSSIAEPEVLAHEFGHFFGLPHSSYRISVMNKRPRKFPAWKDRVFAAPEQRKIRQQRDRMVGSGRLRAFGAAARRPR